MYKSKMSKYFKLLAILTTGIAIGNRVFNHLHAWLGVAIITAVVIFFIYKFIKTLKDEKKD